MSIVEVRGKHNVQITVSLEKIQGAFKSVCPEAHRNADGNSSDMILLSYHQCPHTKDLQQAQSLLTVLQMAEQEGCIVSAEPFRLQEHYDEFVRSEEQGPTPDKKKGIGNER